MENTENYNPYCEICNGCGEDGCCSPINCTMEDGCKYGGSYLISLKEDYLFVREFYSKIYPKLDDDLKKEIMDLYMSIEL
jgi:hypothetical protein